jgi:hypothetical protein
MDEHLLRTLVRGYYFNEAMAFYQQYYRPLVETYPPARETLKDTSRHEDRPPTWVPLVFHCTTEDHIEGIFNDGALTSEKGVVCFTEVPIGELDRMKFRKSPDKHQVAIGFPRRYLERLGLASVLYLKHNPGLQRAWEQIESKKDCEDIVSAMDVLEPFVDKEGDVSPFQEVRVPGSVDMAQAVWVLTTHRDSKNGDLIIPGIEDFIKTHGKLSRSFWHRTHQMGVLTEGQFTKASKNEDGEITDFEWRGEYYWQKLAHEAKKLSVTLPAHTREIIFEFTSREKQDGFEGPWRFIDIAKIILNILRAAGEKIEPILPYRLIDDLGA